MKNVTIAVAIILALGAVFSSVGQAQPSIYIGGGPSAHAGNLTIGVCNAEASRCELTTFEARGSLAKQSDLVYSTSTGIMQSVGGVETDRVKVTLWTLAQIGANVTGGDVGLNVPLGGGITFHPKIGGAVSNWSVTVAGKQVYNTIDAAWKPWVGAQIGYTFRGK
jgi:hypothetical protein